MGGANSTDKMEECMETMENIPVLLHSSLFVSICILIGLSFLTTRKFLWPEHCHGRPGVLVPANLLDAYHHRWSFACAYGSLANVVFLFFISIPMYDIDSAVGKAFATLFGALEICVVFLPMFACLTVESKLIAPIIGLIYSGCWLIFMLLFTIECWNPLPDAAPIIGLAFQGPTMFCLCFLTVKFVLLTVKGFNNHQRHSQDDDVTDRIANKVQLSYVQALFNPTKLTDTLQRRGDAWYHTVLYKLEYFVRKYIYVNQKNFVFSTRILCTVTLGSILIYQMFLILYGVVSILVYELKKETSDDKDPYITAVSVISQLVMWAAIFFNVGQIAFILGKYRFDTLKLYKGDRSFIPKSYNPNNPNVLRRAWLYSGYQIAYMFWGYVVHAFIFSIIGELFLALIIGPFFVGNAGVYYKYYAIAFFVPFAIAMTLRISQYCLAKYVFLQDKIKPTNADKPLALNNKRLWHVVDYFLFMFNILIGIFSSLYRIGLSMALGLVFIGRLDRSVLTAGYERYDKGHMSYLCMLMLEHYHNNPVLRVFCHALVKIPVKQREQQTPDPSAQQQIQYPNPYQLQQNPPQQYPPQQHPSHQSPAPHYRLPQVPSAVDSRHLQTDSVPVSLHQTTTEWKRARNRWQVAYTIMKNPSLMQYRSHRLNKQLPDSAAMLLVLAKHQMLLGLKEKYQDAEVWSKKMEESGIIERVLHRRGEDIMEELTREMNNYNATPTPHEDVIRSTGIDSCVYERDVEVLIDEHSPPASQSWTQ